MELYKIFNSIKEGKKGCNEQKIVTNVADCNPTIPINTLNVYGLNTHIKR